MTTYDDVGAWFAGLHEHIFSTPEFEPLRQLFPVPAEKMNDASFGQSVHVRAVTGITDSLNSFNQSTMIKAIDSYLRQKLFLPTVGGSETVAASQAMAERGHVTLPPVDAAKITDMRVYFDAQQVIPGMHVDGPPLCSVEEARRDSNVARYTTKTVLLCPHVVELACDPDTIALVEAHLGTMPTISDYSAWWSFAEPDEAKEAPLFHRDTEDYRFCKLFIYLTDVDMNSGPHVYMEGTHDPDTIEAIRQRWPNDQEGFVRWYFEEFWKDEETTKRFCAREPVTLTGPAGSRFLVNTQGIHKGLLPKTTDRLICQILYGVSPFVRGTLDSVKMGTPETGRIPAWTVKRPFDYVNRLFVS